MVAKQVPSERNNKENEYKRISPDLEKNTSNSMPPNCNEEDNSENDRLLKEETSIKSAMEVPKLSDSKSKS